MKTISKTRELFILVLSFLLCLVCSIMLYQPALADTVMTDKLTQEQAVLIAEKWKEKNYSSDVVIDRVIPIYESLNSIGGYSISFRQDEKPMGYVVINSRFEDNTFREFSLSGNDIYSQIANKNTAKGFNEYKEKRIYEIDAFDYAIKTENTNKNDFCGIDGSIKTDVSFNEKEKRQNNKTKDSSITYESEHYLDAIVSGDDSVFNGLGSTTETTIWGMQMVLDSTDDFYNKFPYIGSDLRNGTNKGNCAPTAVTNILAFCYYGRGMSYLHLPASNPYEFFQETYNEIVRLSGFNEYGNEGLSDSKAMSALKTFVKAQKYSCNTNKYWLNLWSDFKRDLDKGYFVYTGIRGYSTTEGKTKAHAVVSIGYREYSSGNNFLRVIDGHNDDTYRYINFKDSRLDSVSGTSVDIY